MGSFCNLSKTKAIKTHSIGQNKANYGWTQKKENIPSIGTLIRKSKKILQIPIKNINLRRCPNYKKCLGTGQFKSII